MRRLITLCALVLLLVSSFSVVGCDGESCKKLLEQLENLELQIKDLDRQRRDADAKGEDMNEATELFRQEKNARRTFSETADKYIAKGCVEKTGDVPTLPPMNPLTETVFE